MNPYRRIRIPNKSIGSRLSLKNEKEYAVITPMIAALPARYAFPKPMCSESAIKRMKKRQSARPTIKY